MIGQIRLVCSSAPKMEGVEVWTRLRVAASPVVSDNASFAVARRMLQSSR